jgi:HK97 family phage portal protein
MELWYVPHWLIDPKWPQDKARSEVFVSHYEYRPGGEIVKLPVRDVVHFRFGQDPRNTRLGIGSLKPLLREVFTDEEAANFSAAILRNMGVPGLIVSPGDNSRLTVDQAKEYKKLLKEHFTADARGEPFVGTVKTEVKQFGFDPTQLMLGNLRDITEERVCAMLGIPAAVVGFGAGLQQTKVGATMRELVGLARVNCINPMAKTFSSILTDQLIPDFQSQARRFRVRFDMSEVSIFQEDETQREERILNRVKGGVLRVDQAQALLGLDVDETQAIYLRDGRLVPVPANQELVTEEPSDNGGAPANRLAVREEI